MNIYSKNDEIVVGIVVAAVVVVSAVGLLPRPCRKQLSPGPNGPNQLFAFLLIEFAPMLSVEWTS